MILIPSLEILAGDLVRLRGDSSSEPTVLSDDPLQSARDLRHGGAMFFHVVDLDAVLGQGDNNEVLSRLSEDMIPYQVRGGIKTAERADELLQLGADRVVLGSLPYDDPKAAKDLVKRFGMRVIATLDVKGDRVLVAGDDREEAVDLPQALKALKASGVQQVIYNNVESSGEDAALDLETLKRITTVVNDGALQVYARCTVHRPAELDPLLELHEQGLVGVILNHALAGDSVPFADVLKVAS